MVLLPLFKANPQASEPDFWLTFGPDSDPSVRHKMLYLTIWEISKIGPAAFNTHSVCNQLGVTHPMVNHYFGSRDALIAEAGFTIYETYIKRLWENVEATKPQAEARLTAWLEAQVELHVELGGWGQVLNYPHYWQGIFEQMDELQADRRRQIFELNIARLARLIRDFRNNVVTEIDFSIEDYPREELLLDKRLIEITTTVALSTLGLAVWRSGGHIPSRGIIDLKGMTSSIMRTHQKHMLLIAQAD